MILTKISQQVNKFSEKKQNSIFLSNKLIHSGSFALRKRGYKMAECSTDLIFNFCAACGETHITKTNLCRDRLCPICSWRLSLKRYAGMLQLMQKIDINNYDTAFLTLTVKNCKMYKLSETISAMQHAFSVLTRRKIFCNVVGFAKSVEVTYNSEKQTAHPHIHILLLMKKMTYSNLIINDFKQAWKDILKLDYSPVVDIREIVCGEQGDITAAVLETFKYAIKDTTLAEMPMKDFRAFAEQFAGIRLISFGGILKDVKQALNLQLDDMTEDEETVVACKNCGQPLQEMIAKWSFGDRVYSFMKIEDKQNERV